MEVFYIYDFLKISSGAPLSNDIKNDFMRVEELDKETKEEWLEKENHFFDYYPFFKNILLEIWMFLRFGWLGFLADQPLLII